MSFCEECGAKLAPGVSFCEECGARVSEEAACSDAPAASGGISVDAAVFRSVFRERDWQSSWQTIAEQSRESELGIMLTSLGKLSRQLDTDSGAICDMLEGYASAARLRGVQYYLLDLEDNAIGNGGNRVEDVVATLRQVANVARPKYVFIIGNEDIVDVVSWEFDGGDSDAEVFSDLPYAVLDVTSPFEGRLYDLETALRVGRVPTSDFGLSSLAAYLANAQAGIGTLEVVRPYGLSALVWEAESNYEYSNVSSSTVDVSPEITDKNVKERLNHANLMFFNLHGSDDTEYWYGQRGRSYPQAFAPVALEGYPEYYFLGVEACYGARYIGLPENESLVKTALANKCLAFLGSSKIAYGTPSPKGSCADWVVGEYIKCLAAGETAGDSYIKGVIRLMATDEITDSEVKTLAEFSLYGDPSACMGKNRNSSSFKGLLGSIKSAAKGCHLPMPDVRRAVRMTLAEVDARIEQEIDAYVSEKLMPQLKDSGSQVRQSVFRLADQNLNLKVYSAQAGGVPESVRIYFTDSGKIRKALVSK